jgi:predicted sulfurtransferase
MTKSDDDSQESGGDDIERCDGCDADEQSKELYICQACALTLCSGCWKTQTAHKSKRKSSTRLEATVHEKTKLSTIKLVQPAFSTPADESTIEARLAEDADAAWFGE